MGKDRRAQQRLHERKMKLREETGKRSFHIIRKQTNQGDSHHNGRGGKGYGKFCWVKKTWKKRNEVSEIERLTAMGPTQSVLWGQNRTRAERETKGEQEKRKRNPKQKKEGGKGKGGPATEDKKHIVTVTQRCIGGFVLASGSKCVATKVQKREKCGGKRGWGEGKKR